MRDVRIVVVDALHFLLQVEGELPDFRAISRQKIGEHEFGDGLGWRPFQLAVKISGDNIEAIKKILADGLDVRSFRGGRRLI